MGHCTSSKNGRFVARAGKGESGKEQNLEWKIGNMGRYFGRLICHMTIRSSDTVKRCKFHRSQLLKPTFLCLNPRNTCSYCRSLSSVQQTPENTSGFQDSTFSALWLFGQQRFEKALKLLETRLVRREIES